MIPGRDNGAKRFRALREVIGGVIDTCFQATPKSILTGRSSRRAECPKNPYHGPVWIKMNVRG